MFELSPSKMSGRWPEVTQETTYDTTEVSDEYLFTAKKHRSLTADFKVFTKRRMASITHTAVTIGKLERSYTSTTDPRIDREQFMTWIRYAIRRGVGELDDEDGKRKTDVSVEYKRVYGASLAHDTWESLTCDKDENVMRIVDKIFTRGNETMGDELISALSEQLIHLCYDFVVNIFVHAEQHPLLDLLHEKIDHMYKSLETHAAPARDIVTVCVEFASQLRVAADRVYEIADSVALQTWDARALFPERWTYRIGASAIMVDHDPAIHIWHENAMIERVLVDIYYETLSTRTPLLCIEHSAEWNRCLRPQDLQRSEWDLQIPTSTSCTLLTVAPEVAEQFRKLQAMLDSNAQQHDLFNAEDAVANTLDACTRALTGEMPGLEHVTFRHAATAEFEREGATETIGTMQVDLSFARVGHTNDVLTTLVTFGGRLGLLVFERQQSRARSVADPADGVQDKPTGHELQKALALFFKEIA